MIKYLFLTNIIIINLACAYNNTPKYWNCKNKKFGSWNFGNFAESCNVDVLIDEQITSDIYFPLIYQENENSSFERTRFMNLMYATLKNVASYYFQKRDPQATQLELEAWEKAVFAMSNQESYWSHYRNNNHKLQVMRGDYGHGHGIMQVDDRWHFDYIKDGRAWGLVPHFIFSLDMFYSAWQKAKTKWCVDSTTNYVAITRSAYSAYNGGMGSLCRWTDPNHRWARNDKNFWEKFSESPWENKISDFSLEAPIDINCLANNKTNCRPSRPGEDLPQENILYSEDNGQLCFFKDEKFHCVDDEKFVGCFYDIFSLKKENYVKKSIQNHYRDDYDFENIEGHRLCKNVSKGIYQVGQSIELHKNINMRETPAGKKVSVINQSTHLQVLDYLTMLNDFQKRYYKVRSGKHEGFIYAGNANDFQDWSTLSNKKTKHLILQAGDQGKIENSAGINVRNSIGGEIISYVSHGDKVQIDAFFVTDKNNSVYYKLGEEFQNGFIYGGQVSPDFTLTNWVQFSEKDKEEKPEPMISELKDKYFYSFLLDCTASSCRRTYKWILGPAAQQEHHQFYVLEQVGENAKIKTIVGNISGFIPVSMIKEDMDDRSF